MMPDVHRPARYFRLTGWLTSPAARLNRTAHYRVQLQRLRADLSENQVLLLSFCLLPNAWHLVVAAPDRRSVDSLAGRVTATQRAASDGSAVPLPVVVAPIRAAADLIDHCVFVERRPVALGLVRQAQDWPWCSPAERFRLQTRVPLVSAPILMSQMWLDGLLGAVPPVW